MVQETVIHTALIYRHFLISIKKFQMVFLLLLGELQNHSSLFPIAPPDKGCHKTCCQIGKPAQYL